MHLLGVRVQLEREEHAVYCQQNESETARHHEQVVKLLSDRHLSTRASDRIDRIRRVGVGVMIRGGKGDRGELT